MIKVLMVDDSHFSQKINGDLIKGFLENSEIYYAKDGKEGFKKYKEIKPDYIFVDLLMPVIGGKELVKMIKAYDKDANIIVISADIQNSVKEEMESYKVLQFINKPLNFEKAEKICNLIKEKNNE